MKAVGIFVAALALAACNLTPVYSGGTRSVAAETLGAISVPAIQGREGYLVRQALLDRFPQNGDVRYRVDVRLDDDITGLGIRGDDSITRERRTLRARWQLIDTSSGVTLLDETVRRSAGIDVVSSDYAVVAAETDALERLSQEVATEIATRVAVFAKEDIAVREGR
ncbi:MAG: LPS assembly lipoprotein LptE [Pacificimonas sp.]